jgi:hypothetical protein
MRFYKHLLWLAAVVAGLVWSTFAGTLTNVSITGSDTNPGATWDYTFTYTVENTVPNADWAFCISTNPWDNSLGLFQHTISLSVDGSPVGTDNSMVHGGLWPNGSLCLSVNTDANSWSAVSTTIEDLVNPGTWSHQIYLFTYNWSILDTLSGDYYDLQIWPIDTTAPETIITFAGGDTVDSPSATFEFISNEDPVTFECSIDDGVTIEDFAPCVSPYTRTGFLYGEHIFYVRAVDPAQNPDASPASRTWTIADSEEIVSVTPADGETNVATDATIVVTFAQPVLLDITIASGPCDGSWSMCPVLDGVWSSGNTILTYTRTDEDFHNDTTYSIQITENNGINWHQLYSWAFTIVAASQGGGGGWGGSANPSRDYCPGEDTSPSFYDRSCGNIVETWEKFYAMVSSGGISTVSDPITVKWFVTDVFTLLWITKSVQRKDDSETQTVPEKLVMKVMQILQRILNK